MRLVLEKREKFGLLGGIIIVCALALAVVLTSCGPSLPAVAMPSPVLFGDATTCLVEAARILPATEAAKYCLEARRLEADRAEVAVVAVAKAEEAKASRPSFYSAFGGYGAYGTMPVMRGGVFYSSSGGYNTVGGMVVRTGPSFVRSGGGGTNIVPRFSPPPRRRP